jgi:hypothetical protein
MLYSKTNNNRRFSRKNKERIKEELGKCQCEPIEYRQDLLYEIVFHILDTN